jgi:chromatin segregation and condensation protein Rec8/ScpA/Scc1 (kleisin family)
MNQEENILKTIIEKESWEEIIYHIVSVENLDPWDIDLIKLTQGFIRFIRTAQELDFRIPAKIVFVVAILLKLKADYLSIFEEKESKVEEALKEEKPFEDLGIDPSLAIFAHPIKRIPKRQVTLDELIKALKKALEVHERKIKRRISLQARLRAEVSVENAAQKIEKVLKEIEEALEKTKREKQSSLKYLRKFG